MLLTLMIKISFCNAQVWLNAGQAIGPEPKQLFSIAVARDTPYVAYGNYFFGKVVLKKLSGQNWQEVDPAGIPVNINSLDMSVIGSAEYIAYENLSNLINVKKFDGLAWTNVGPVDFAHGTMVKTATLRAI